MALDAINLWNSELLQRYQEEILGWLGQSVFTQPTGKMPSTFTFEKARTSGTTAATDANEILGNVVTQIVLDEMGGERLSADLFRRELLATVLPPVAVFRDPRYPGADVTVEEEILNKNHPLNPNPQAGPVTQWVIVTNGRRSKPLRSLALAKASAKSLHERLVAALIDEVKERIPSFGVFG